MNIQERLALFYLRLEAAPPAASAEQALALIARTLEGVENEFCAVPRSTPAPLQFEGRMYLPQSDNINVQDDGSTWVKTRRHRILISPDGSFIIYRQMPHKSLLKEFQKSGANP
jgi:hypothetical protein